MTHDDRWVAIDFETATNEAHSACALGMAVVDGGIVVETRSWLVQPPANEYHWYCTKVHGLTSEDTAQSPTFDEVWDEVRPYLEAGRLLAHNAPFDARVLAALADHFDLDAPEAHIACTVSMSRAAMPHLRDHKLGTVSDACGIALNHHEAQSDALACAHIAIACTEECGADTIAEALEQLGVSTRRVG